MSCELWHKWENLEMNNKKDICPENSITFYAKINEMALQNLSK